MEQSFAKKQIARMVQMRGFPNTKEAADDMIDALMTAETEEVGKAVISGFLEDATPDTNCPMASQIKAAVQERLRIEFGDSRADPECPLCNGVGFPLSERGAGPKCSCWARRHAPDWRKLKGSEPIGPKINEQLKQLVASKTGGSK